jgi:hypothetical protein
MNELILSVVKERLLPLTSDFIDYPNAQFESQLHRLSIFIAKSILDAFVAITHWSLYNASKQNAHSITEESRLSMALKSIFPLEWLRIAETSPSYHLRLHKVIQRYRFALNESSVKRIHTIVEFLCFEIIESAVIHSGFKPMFQLTGDDLALAICRDAMLHEIVTRHNIFLVPRPPSVTWIEFPDPSADVQISIKGYRLLRVYVEELIREVFRRRSSEYELTLNDVDAYFKIHPPSE